MDYSIAQPSLFNRNWWSEPHLSIDVNFHMTTKFSSHGLLYSAIDWNPFKSYGAGLKAFLISASSTSPTYDYIQIISFQICQRQRASCLKGILNYRSRPSHDHQIVQVMDPSIPQLRYRISIHKKSLRSCLPLSHFSIAADIHMTARLSRSWIARLCN